ncbi:restriction endonuclease subunit S [Lysinibacillus sp. NPDC093197]|uniref:restriction endonuclease subunit S n=1 Tax=Lysinibacillus sp. NPDC093197 TaxID=3364132 RepID=UPI0038115B22
MAVPKLRFKGFENEWFQHKIGDFFEHLATGSTPSRIDSDYFKGDIPWISSGELKSHYVSSTKEYITEKAVKDTNLKIYPPGTMFIAITGLEAKGTRNSAAINTIPMTTNQSCLAFPLNDLLNLDFLYYWYKKNGEKIGITYTQGTKQQSLTPGLVKNLDIVLPSIEEQAKIAQFFNLIELKIEHQKEKIDLLKEQKKGFMQKIFNQELRFKDEDGQAFPEWEKKPLGDLGEFGVSYSYSRSCEGEGLVQHIHYGDIHTKLPTICDKVQFPSITEQRDFEFVNDGDILFADASEDYNDLGKAILIRSLQSVKTVAGLHTHKFIPKESVYPLYLIYVTQTKGYREFIKKMGTGVSVLGISKTNLAKFDILLPSLNEQIKIGEFLFSFDQKIHSLNSQLDYLSSQKQAFMQQMFI